MASSNPSELAKLLESVSVTNDGSAAEEALSNLFGTEAPLDAGVESAAGAIAEKLGLQSKNSTIQTGVFVLTKAAILETASLVGLGSGLAKLDLMSFKMAQLAKQVEAIDKKLDVILSAPIKLAVDFFVKAMCHLENENIPGTIKEMEHHVQTCKMLQYNFMSMYPKLRNQKMYPYLTPSSFRQISASILDT